MERVSNSLPQVQRTIAVVYCGMDVGLHVDTKCSERPRRRPTRAQPTVARRVRRVGRLGDRVRRVGGRDERAAGAAAGPAELDDLRGARREARDRDRRERGAVDAQRDLELARRGRAVVADRDVPGDRRWLTAPPRGRSR